MTRDQHIALGEAISELCNPDAGWTDRSNTAHALRKAFGMPEDHTKECACNDPDLEPEDMGNACDCGYWDAIYPADMKPKAA